MRLAVAWPHLAAHPHGSVPFCTRLAPGCVLILQKMRHAIRAEEPAEDLLLDRARNGDGQAFEQIVRQHQSMVFSLAYRVSRNRNTAEELAQDVFLELYRSLNRLTSDAHVTHWLRRVTSHRCIDWCRRNRPRHDGPMENSRALSVSPTSRDVLFEERLWQLVAALAPDPRMVVI